MYNPNHNKKYLFFYRGLMINSGVVMIFSEGGNAILCGENLAKMINLWLNNDFNFNKNVYFSKYV